VEQMTDVLPHALTAVPVNKPLLSEFSALPAQIGHGQRATYPRA
jgi:hypothetical protein